MRNKELARKMIVAYFHYLSTNGELYSTGLAEMFLVKNDDKVLLEHIYAWIDILEEAKKEMEKS